MEEEATLHSQSSRFRLRLTVNELKLRDDILHIDRTDEESLVLCELRVKRLQAAKMDQVEGEGLRFPVAFYSVYNCEAL